MPVLLLCAQAAIAADTPRCRDADLLAFVPKSEVVAAHRQHELPVLRYPYGTRLVSYPGGLQLTLRVDARGAVACYRAATFFDEPVEMNERRRRVIRDLADWRYTPFLDKGEPVTAIVTEVVGEEENPARHLEPPDVPLAQVHIGLRRTGCFGTCSSYSVDLYGDGHAVYNGTRYVDVVGKHRYPLAPDAMAKLRARLRELDLWSLRARYHASVSDMPAYIVTMQLGKQTHTIEDYLGEGAGMPAAVTEFEKEIDEAAGSEAWLDFARPALEQLKVEGFPFASPAGGALLNRAVANPDAHDDAAVLELIRLGAPTDAVADDEIELAPGERHSLLERALQNQRLTVFKALAANDALRTNGAMDAHKVDAAFRAAVESGNLTVAQTVWDSTGAESRPSLTFEDHDDRSGTTQRSPVTLLLRKREYLPKNWQGLDLVKWLESLGCDLRARAADGTALLHIAADAGDAPLVRYLLDRGIDPSTPGQYNLVALGSVQDNEDIALMLLEAGSSLATMTDGKAGYRRYAEYQHWARVVAWLDAHAE